jgi:hypothetical protein
MAGLVVVPPPWSVSVVVVVAPGILSVVWGGF